MKSVKQAIKERHTTKRYKPGPEITNDQILEIIEAAHLAPSANNLQDSEILVIKDLETRKEYAKHFEGFNQLNIEQAQALFILKGTPWKMELLNNGQRIMDVNIGHYDVPEEEKQRLLETVMNYYSTKSGYSESLDIYTSTIHFSFMVLQATEMGFHSTPMLGIQKNNLEKFMLEQGTLEQGQRVNLAFTIGYEDENDDYNKLMHKKIRVDKDKIYKII